MGLDEDLEVLRKHVDKIGAQAAKDTSQKRDDIARANVIHQEVMYLLKRWVELNERTSRLIANQILLCRALVLVAALIPIATVVFTVALFVS